MSDDSSTAAMVAKAAVKANLPAPAAAPEAVAVAEAASVGVVEPLVSLADFMNVLHQQDRRYELVAAFAKAQQRAARWFATAAEYQACFAAFVSQAVR
jgi:hypothetical protein